MLTRYAERRGFKVEELGLSENDSGGVKEATFAIKGDGAYSIFKWEGGTHRVQRVPETESQGRIHTSTGDGRGHAGGRGGRRPDRRERPARSTSTARPGRAARASTRPTRPCGSRTCRPARSFDAGREVAAPEPPEGDARAARAAARGRAGEAARRAGRAAALAGRQRASGPRRSAPTTSRRTASPTTACM